MDRRKFLRNAISAAVAVGGAGAIEAATNSAEASPGDPISILSFGFGEDMRMLFNLKKERPDKQAAFEQYFSQKLETYLDAYASTSGKQRSGTTDLSALNEAMFRVGVMRLDSDIVTRLSQELGKRLPR